jgi:hypothetical protein
MGVVGVGVSGSGIALGGVQEAGRSQPDFWRVLGQMRIIAAVMTAPPMSHSRPACARGAMGAITAIPITMTRSPSIVSSKFRGISVGATPGRGDSVSRCDRQHSSALSARQRRSDDVPRPQNRASYIAAERRQNQRVRLRNVDERLGLFPAGQQTAARASSKICAAASRSDSTGGAHRDGGSQLRSGC